MDSKALQYIKKLGPLIGLILLFIIISVMNDSFLEFSNLRNLLRQVSINAIIAFGMTFVILTGGIDLSVGSILALSSAVMANLIVTGTDPVLAIVLAAGAGLVLGGINGLVITYGRVAPIYRYLGDHDNLPWCDASIHRRQPNLRSYTRSSIPRLWPRGYCRPSSSSC